MHTTSAFSSSYISQLGPSLTANSLSTSSSLKVGDTVLFSFFIPSSHTAVVRQSAAMRDTVVKLTSERELLMSQTESMRQHITNKDAELSALRAKLDQKEPAAEVGCMLLAKLILHDHTACQRPDLVQKITDQQRIINDLKTRNELLQLEIGKLRLGATQTLLAKNAELSWSQPGARNLATSTSRVDETATHVNASTSSVDRTQLPRTMHSDPWPRTPSEKPLHSRTPRGWSLL